MKTFKIDGIYYQAQDCIDEILIKPILPDNFYTEPLEDRTEEHMRRWQNLPFIVLDNEFYKVYRLDGGAFDRPTLRGAFQNLQQAVKFIKDTYRSV